MFVAPLYHWNLAPGWFVAHLNVCGVPDITLIEFKIGVYFNNTRSMGTETMFVRFVNKLHQSIITKHGDIFLPLQILCMLRGHYFCKDIRLLLA